MIFRTQQAHVTGWLGYWFATRQRSFGRTIRILVTHVRMCNANSETGLYFTRSICHLFTQNMPRSVLTVDGARELCKYTIEGPNCMATQADIIVLSWRKIEAIYLAPYRSKYVINVPVQIPILSWMLYGWLHLFVVSKFVEQIENCILLWSSQTLFKPISSYYHTQLFVALHSQVYLCNSLTSFGNVVSIREYTSRLNKNQSKRIY